MKPFLLSLACLLACSVITFGQEHLPGIEETLIEWTKTEKEENRAKKDDRVLIVIVKVKGDQKEAFEKWIDEVLYTALRNSERLMKKAQLKTTRWMEPVRANEDGSWTYSWIMDPIIPKTDYDIPTFLNDAYGEELGKEHWASYMAFMAEPPRVFVFKQTDY